MALKIMDALGYINDIILIVISKLVYRNNQKLDRVHN